MASSNVLTFDAEGRAVDFDVWVDDLQLFLQCDSKDGVSLFDHTFGISPALAATADSMVRSQWTTRDAVASFALRSHLPSAERAHFGQYKTAKSLYDDVVARYSSPATAALSRLMLPYLFPDFAAFATIADLITHLRTSDARYRTALPTEFCAKNPPPPMYITLYYLVTRLPDSLASVRDHFLSLCPTELTVDHLEERLTAAEKSIVAVGASRGDPRAPFLEGYSPSPISPLLLLLLLLTSFALRRSGLCLLLVGGAAIARARGARVVEGTVEAVEEAEGVAVEVGVVAEVGASVAAVGVVEAAAAAVEAAAAVVEVAVAVELVEGGATQRGGFGGSQRQHAEGDCYLCVPPDPGIEAAALGARASATPGTSESAAPSNSESAAPGAGESALSGTAPTEALHTFTLDSGVSRSFFRDNTTLTPLSRPVAVSLADPSGGPVLAHSSTVLPCPAAPSGLLSGPHLPSFSTNLVSGADIQDLWVDQFTPGGQRVTHCTCSRTGRHLATFTCWPGSSLYTLTTPSPPVTAPSQVAASGQVFAAASRSIPVSAPYSCRPLSHKTLLWHHRLGHPSLPRLRGMASRTLVSGLPRCLPPLPPGPAPTCVPCVEGRQRAASHSSEFPPTEAPLQTLHMDMWGPARVSGQGHESYFLLIVDDYSRYTTVFPLRRKGEVTEMSIGWIRGARRQLSESFDSDLLVLRLHSDRGGEFSSDLLRAFCRAEGIRETFMLPASPQQNGIAECRIGMAMDVARTSMIHAAAPHFLWPFAVEYAAHQINLQPRVSLLETTPTLRWTGKVGDASVFRVWGSRAFVRDTSADKLLAVLPPHLASCSVLSGCHVDPVEHVEVAVDSGAARGAEPAGAGPGGAATGVDESEGVEPGGAEPERVEPGGAEPGGAESGGAESRGAEPGGAEPERAESGGLPGVLLELRGLLLEVLSGAGATRGAAGAGAARAAGPGGAGAGGTGAVGGPIGVGAAGGAGAAGVGAVGAGAVATRDAAGAGAAGGTGAGGAAGVVAGDPGAEGTGAVSASQLQPASPLPGPSPYSGLTRGLTERCEPESRPASPESRPASHESRPASPKSRP
ncbi:unnamed protein product [Closterium sp. NIES-53]